MKRIDLVWVVELCMLTAAKIDRKHAPIGNDCNFHGGIKSANDIGDLFKMHESATKARDKLRSRGIRI